VQGPNRYGYVGGNPETRTDPSGNCFIVCAAIGAAVGFVGDLAVQEASSIANGQGFTTNLDWGQAATWAVAGAVIGGTGGLAAGAVLGWGGAGAGAALFGADLGAGGLGLSGTAATVANSAAIGGFFGSTSSLLGGILHGDRGDRLAHDTIIGGITGIISGAITGVLGAASPPMSALPGGSPPNPGLWSIGQMFTSSMLQGFVAAGGSILGNVWNGEPIDPQAAGVAFLLGAVFSAPGSYVGQARIAGGSSSGQLLYSWGGAVSALWDGGVQGVLNVWNQSRKEN
jgi:hypothetical protein